VPQLKPVSHEVLWGAELTAAATLIAASTLEWPLDESTDAGCPSGSVLTISFAAGSQ
jgi:hypothetical protein